MVGWRPPRTAGRPGSVTSIRSSSSAFVSAWSRALTPADAASKCRSRALSLSALAAWSDGWRADRRGVMLATAVVQLRRSARTRAPKVRARANCSSASAASSALGSSLQVSCSRRLPHSPLPVIHPLEARSVEDSPARHPSPLRGRAGRRAEFVLPLARDRRRGAGGEGDSLSFHGRWSTGHKSASVGARRRRSRVHRTSRPVPGGSATLGLAQAVATAPLAWLSRARATRLVNDALSDTAISASILRLISTPAALRPAISRL